MKTISLLVLSALLYSSMAVNGSIKNKLGQVARTNLAELESEQTMNCTLDTLAAPSLAFCECNLSTGAPAPGGSA